MAAFRCRLALHIRNVLHAGDEILHDRKADLLMGDLAAAEADRNLDLISTLQELDGRLRLGLDVIFLDRGGKLDLIFPI